MERSLLNEHDANQGAQSRGEFLGMTGNSGWYLLGSIATSLLMVILCWGVLGISLLLCLLVGLILCGASVAYVFTLKNNRPEHYDTDFFESVLIEAGVMEMAFGPRGRRIRNPFTAHLSDVPGIASASEPRRSTNGAAKRLRQGHQSAPVRSEVPAAEPAAEQKRMARTVREPVVPLSAYEHLRDELDTAEDLLEDLSVERMEG